MRRWNKNCKMGDKEIFIKKCIDFIDTHSSEYADKVLIYSVILKTSSGHWTNCLTLFKILKKGESIILRDEIRYDIFALVEETVSLDRFKKIIEHIWGGFQIKDYDVRFNGTHFIEKYLPNHNEFSNWPGLYFEVGNNPGENDLQELRSLDYPLVKFKVPCYMSGYEAAADWLKIKDFHVDGGRLGKALLFLPNFKARIKNISYEDDDLKLYIDSEIRNKLECQFVIKFENKTLRKNEIIENNELGMSLKLEDEPVITYVQLIASNAEKDEKLDYYYEDSFRHSGTIRFIKKGASKKILDLISNGENENVEFKPYTRFDKSKDDEIMETVIAFANTSGGSILFGIKDDSKIVGIPQNVLENGTEAKFIEEFKRYIRRTTSNKTNGITLDFKDHQIGKNLILEVSVKEGDKKPYSHTENNLIWVRRGSTDRPPSTDELKNLFGINQ